MRLVARRSGAIFFFAAARVGLRFGITFGFFIIPGMSSSLSNFTHRQPMRFCKCLAATHRPSHFGHMFCCVVDAMALQRGLLPCRQFLHLHGYLRDFLPTHFQRLRDRRNGLFGLRAALGCFFI